MTILESLYDSLDEKQRAVMKYSVDLYSFVNEIIGPHNEPEPLVLTDFQKEWLDLIHENDYFLLLASRRHGKTTVVGSYVIWRILYNPNITVLIVTLNQTMADRMMRFIKGHLETNPKIEELYGKQKGIQEWSNSAIRVEKQGRGIKEPTVSVAGWESAMAGGGYDIRILDDITDLKYSATEGRRHKTREWLRHELLPMQRKRGGKLVVLATRYHFDDIYNTMMNEAKFDYKIYKAITNEDELQENPKAKPKVLWPERWSYDALMELKEKMGSTAFEMQMQNNPLPETDTVVRLDWIEGNRYRETIEGKYQVRKYIKDRDIDEYVFDPGPYYENLHTGMGVDLSTAQSLRERGDFFVVITVGVDDNGEIYVLNMYRGKKSPKEKIQIMEKYAHEYNVSRVCVDATAMQEEIKKLFAELSNLNFRGVKGGNKQSRIDYLAMLFEQGKIHIPMGEGYGQMIEELVRFGRCEYDDIPDALFYAIQATGGGKQHTWGERHGKVYAGRFRIR